MVELFFDFLKYDSGGSINKATLRTVDCQFQLGMMD
jgi:hypothetical protein